MGSPAVRPFTTFAFAVEIRVPFLGGGALFGGSFAECDGLDMTMDVKTIREGGHNDHQIRMVGAVNFGTLTLKRGMTASFDLWDWFDAVQHANPKQLRTQMRAKVDVVILPSDHKKGVELARFHLEKCLLTKLKAPALNAKDGGVAIEELQIAYESLALMRPNGGG